MQDINENLGISLYPKENEIEKPHYFDKTEVSLEDEDVIESNLKKSPVLSDFQDYIKKLENEKGFSHETVRDKCLLLGEEVGELFKSVRKAEGIGIDKNSSVKNISDELADIFIYLCAIANRFEVNLEDAFREKDKINKERIWEKALG